MNDKTRPECEDAIDEIQAESPIVATQLKPATCLQKNLWWWAGAVPELVEQQSGSSRIVKTNSGILALANLCFLLFIWTGVLTRYLGIWGFLGGILVAIIIIAVDRNFVMGHYRVAREGPLAVYAEGEPRQKMTPKILKLFARGIIAILLVSVSAFTFVLGIADSAIETERHKQYTEGNAQLRAEITREVSGANVLEARQIDLQKGQLLRQQEALSTEIDTHSKQSTEALFQYRTHYAEMAAEEGGLGRPGRCGPKCEAHRQIALKSQAIHEQLKISLDKMQVKLDSIGASIVDLDNRRVKLEKIPEALHAEIDGLVKKDPRYKELREGNLISDASLLLTVMSSDDHKGLWLIALISALFLIALEGCFLISSLTQRITVYEAIALPEEERVEAAREVARRELEIIRATSDSPVYIDPLAQQDEAIPSAEVHRG
ncbi:hypothetical protein AGMMS50256_17350 [Betaproteobacteria bacterium]|nr:hypothetical protein AGMMS50256_17350 [Betaproteobacteria bacterium]